MLFDTDIFIWVQRGNAQAARLIEQSKERYLSVFTRMELLQGARDQRHQDALKDFFSDFGFSVLPLTENVGHRALVYIEEYALSHGLRAGDAVIAATATENHFPLLSGNAKHYKFIKDLTLKSFQA